MRLKVVKYIALVIGSLLLKVALGQPVLRLSSDKFLEAVSTHPEIQAHAEALDIHAASIDVARISPDPSIVVGNMSGDVSGINMPHQLFVGMNYTMETGGKKRQRVRYAEAQLQLARAEHMAFENQFKRNALEMFQQCWKLEQQIGEVVRFREKIVALRVNDTDMLLKQQLMLLENDQKQKELQVEFDKVTAEVNDLVHHTYGDQPVLPESWVWSYEANIPSSKGGSAQVEVSKASADVLKEEVMLASTHRVPDLSFTVGNNFITRATNKEAPSPSYNAITATVAMPLKFSNAKGAEKKRDALRTANARNMEVSAIEEADNKWKSTVEEVKRLSESFSNLNTLVALQEKVISKVSTEDVFRSMNELTQLNSYKTQRWTIFESITKNKADLFEMSGVLPANKQMEMAESN